MHMVQLMPLHPKTPSSLASFKSRLLLPFWYWLTQIFLIKEAVKETRTRKQSALDQGLRLCVCVLLLDVKMPLPEDSDLECFLPVHKALRSAAANTVVSDVLFTIAIM